MLKYIFCTYDVWGDEDDYEVNNIMKFTERPIFIHEDASLDDVEKILVAEGFLNGEASRNGLIDIDHSASPDFLEFYDLGTNLPFARIELVAQGKEHKGYNLKNIRRYKGYDQRKICSNYR